MFRFAHPLAFLLLLPLLVGAVMIYRRRVRSAIVFSATARIPTSVSGWRRLAATLLPLLVLIGLVGSIMALARPQTVFSRSTRNADVIAIEMVVDISESMKALDMSEISARGEITKAVTRLEAVKEAFAGFIARRPDDLIGLITFGGYAATRSPLTGDHDALLHILKGTEIPGTVSDAEGRIVNQEELMTAIGDGLATACARLKDVAPKSRVIVLLSDGESNTGLITPEQATRLAKELDIKVYTIGVGSRGMAPFRGRDVFGRERIVQSRVNLDEAALRAIANQTGGRYYNVRDPKGLDAAITDIDKLEKTRIERDVYHQYNEWANWFLLPSLALVMTGTALNMLITRRIV